MHNNDLGDKTTASTVTGNDAFSKINTLKSIFSDITIQSWTNGILAPKTGAFDLLDGSASNINVLQQFDLGSAVNLPSGVPNTGTGMRIMFKSDSSYFRTMSIFMHCDTGNIYYNFYHSALSRWDGWKLLSASNYSPMMATLGGQGAIANALAIDLTNRFDKLNEVGYVYSGGTAGLPTNCTYGIREVYYYNSNTAWVKITGCDTSSNFAVWGRMYNNGNWTDWKQL